jgi:hypothetical protein
MLAALMKLTALVAREARALSFPVSIGVDRSIVRIR